MTQYIKSPSEKLEAFDALIAIKEQRREEKAARKVAKAAGKPFVKPRTQIDPGKKGERAKRNAPGDKLCRARVALRDEGMCQTCLVNTGEPVRGTDWSHFHTRNSHKGVDLRQDPKGSMLQCRKCHNASGPGKAHQLILDGYVQSQITDGTLWQRLLSDEGCDVLEPWQPIGEYRTEGEG